MAAAATAEEPVRPNSEDQEQRPTSGPSSFVRRQSSGLTKAEPEDANEEPLESMDEILAQLDAQQKALRKQQRKDDRARSAVATKQLAEKRDAAAQGAKQFFAPPPAFKRPSAAPQEFDGFKRLPVKYLEAKDAAIMDRPERVSLYSSKDYPPFLHGDSVPRTFDDKRVLNLVKAKDPTTKLSLMHFLSEPMGHEVPEEPRQLVASKGPGWKTVNSTPRELNASKPLLERAGKVALLASEGPRTAR